MRCSTEPAVTSVPWISFRGTEMKRSSRHHLVVLVLVVHQVLTCRAGGRRQSSACTYCCSKLVVQVNLSQAQVSGAVVVELTPSSFRLRSMFPIHRIFPITKTRDPRGSNNTQIIRRPIIIIREIFGSFYHYQNCIHL